MFYSNDIFLSEFFSKQLMFREEQIRKADKLKAEKKSADNLLKKIADKIASKAKVTFS